MLWGIRFTAVQQRLPDMSLQRKVIHNGIKLFADLQTRLPRLENLIQIKPGLLFNLQTKLSMQVREMPNHLTFHFLVGTLTTFFDFEVNRKPLQMRCLSQRLGSYTGSKKYVIKSTFNIDYAPVF